MPIHKREFDAPPYQDRFNGPLNAEVQARLNRIRNERGYSLADLGKALGFSGPFMSTLLREGNAASIRTRHMERFIKSLGELEVAEELAGTPISNSEEQAAPNGMGKDVPLDDLIRAIHAKGFAVTLGPLPRS